MDIKYFFWPSMFFLALQFVNVSDTTPDNLAVDSVDRSSLMKRAVIQQGSPDLVSASTAEKSLIKRAIDVTEEEMR